LPTLRQHVSLPQSLPLLFQYSSSSSYPPSEILLPHNQSAPTTNCHPASHNHSSLYNHPVVISTNNELAHAPTVNSSTSASTAKQPTQSTPAPLYLWGIPLFIFGGACTPLWPLTLECELCNQQLLISDIRQGCNIGYIGPQFTSTARHLQSAFVNPSISPIRVHSN